jgi:hypothetical protein
LTHARANSAAAAGAPPLTSAGPLALGHPTSVTTTGFGRRRVASDE